MTADNVELVRSGLAAFLAGDMERTLTGVHPDVVTVRHPPLPDAQTYHGPDGLLQSYADWTADFSDFEMEVGEIRSAGDGVLVELIQRGKGQASGAIVEGRFWAVYTLTDGLVTRQDIFNYEDQAAAWAKARRSAP